MSLTTTKPVVDSLIRSNRIKNMQKLCPQIESLLSQYDFKEGDPILLFCRMARDVCDDAAFFMEQFKDASWNKYLAVNAQAPLTNPPAPVLAAPILAAPVEEVKPKKSKKPRKGRSAETIFVAENRKATKALPEHKDKKSKEITVVLKGKWSQMDAEGKKSYEEKAVKEEEKYKEAMKTYIPPVKEKKEKKKRKKKDPNAPKKAQTSWLIFGDKVRADVKKANEGKSKEEQKKAPSMKEIAELWKQVAAEDRKPYETLAAKAKEEHKKLMDAYNKAKQVEQATPTPVEEV